MQQYINGEPLPKGANEEELRAELLDLIRQAAQLSAGPSSASPDEERVRERALTSAQHWKRK